MRNFSYAVLGLFLFLIGCNIQDVDFSNLKVEKIKSDLAVPFGTASYTMRELIDDVADADLNLEEDLETGEMKLMYTQSASYTFTPDIFSINDNVESTNLNISDAPDGSGAFAQNIPFVQTYESVDEEVVDSIYHGDNAMVRIEISSTSVVPITFTLELTNTTDMGSGTPISFTGTVSGGTEMDQAALLNHKTLFSEVAGENSFNVSLDLSANLGAGQSFSSDQISVSIEFVTQEFIVAFGKMGQDTVDISSGETFDIAFFDDFGVDGLDFGNPELVFDVRSSFGVPIGLGLAGLYGEQSNGTRTYLGGTVIGTPPVIQSASMDHPVTGEPVQSVLTINSQNSTLQELLSTTPSTIGLGLTGMLNPNDANAGNFVTDTSSVRTDVELTLPMEVRFADLQHSLDFDIAGSADFTEADSLSLRVVTVNELPFAATMDIYLIDQMGDTTYTVLNNQALDIPFLNIDRTVREPKTSIDDIPFGPDGITALNEADKIRVVFTMNTPASLTSENIFVKLLSTAKLEVSLAARGIVEIDL